MASAKAWHDLIEAYKAGIISREIALTIASEWQKEEKEAESND